MAKKLKKDFSLSKKRWLNKIKYHSIGLVYVEAEDLKGDYPTVYLTIGDCGRTVTLDFCYTDEDYKGSMANARHKLNVLRKSLDDIERSLDVVDEYRKPREKKLKKNK